MIPEGMSGMEGRRANKEHGEYRHKSKINIAC